MLRVDKRAHACTRLGQQSFRIQIRERTTFSGVIQSAELYPPSTFHQSAGMCPVGSSEGLKTDDRNRVAAAGPVPQRAAHQTPRIAGLSSVGGSREPLVSAISALVTLRRCVSRAWPRGRTARSDSSVSSPSLPPSSSSSYTSRASAIRSAAPPVPCSRRRDRAACELETTGRRRVALRQRAPRPGLHDETGCAKERDFLLLAAHLYCGPSYLQPRPLTLSDLVL